MNDKTILGWYFAPPDNRLAHGDGREVVIGETHTVEGETELCVHGLHWSRRLIDALRYATGPILYRVEVWGDVKEEGDKGVALNRRYVAGFDATDVLRDFARRSALDVTHSWDVRTIAVMRYYLSTGDESIRFSAWKAAWAAAVDVAWYADADAASAADAALAWEAVRDAQNRRLTAMVSAKMGRCEPLGVG